MTRPPAILCVLALCLTGAATARGEPSREHQLKAAFLYNFVQFVEWPADAFADAKSPIVIGVAADEDSDEALEHAVAGKTVGGRPLAVRRVGRPDDVAGCHLLYIPAAGEQDLAALVQRTGGRPVLTVGETEKFMARGGIIRFYQDDNKLRFEINADAAQHCRLKISAKLLRLARIRHE